MRVVTFNCWVGQEPDKLRRNLLDLVDDLTFERTGKPHILALQEAKHFDGSIRGYERYAVDEGHNDNSSNVMLVRERGVEITHRHKIEAEGPWWQGPRHGLMHPPKVFPAVTVVVDGQAWIVADLHRIPNRAMNPEAAAYETKAIVEWSNSRKPGRPLAMVGDLNGSSQDPELRRLATATNTTLAVRGIDGGLVRNCDVQSAVKLSGLYGSDSHRPVVMNLKEDS